MKPVSELGEFQLISQMKEWLGENRHTSSLLGIGDDAAIIQIDEENAMLVSTDMFVEGVHFDLSYMPPVHLGYKVVSASVSDIYAMNAVAEHIFISLSISSKFTVEFLEEFYKGIRYACNDFKVDVLGGDTTSSRVGLSINITAIGKEKTKNIVKRSTAKANDIVLVSGDIGAAFMGLQILEREKRVFLDNPQAQPELADYAQIVGKQLRPISRRDLIQELKTLEIMPTAMIDVSDGVSSEAIHIAKASGLGVVLYEEKLPIDELTKKTALELHLDPYLSALHGGEDYELMITLSPSDYDKIRNHPDFTPIGYMQDATQGNLLVRNSGTTIELKAQGFNHFAQEE